MTKKELSKKETQTLTCYKCGRPLTEDNSFESKMPICIDCQCKDFIDLEQANGIGLAVYLCCAKYDLPCLPLLLPDNFEEEKNKWAKYLEILQEKDVLVKNDRLADFNDGETYILRLFGKEMSEKDFGKYVAHQKSRIAKIPGTEKQRQEWGTLAIWQNLPMTTEIYNELDRMYEDRLNTYKGVTLSDSTKATIRRVCKLTFAQDYLQSLGDASGVDKIQKTIDSILSAEQLRRKDEKPVENFRVDSMVKALEDAGLMEDGKFLSFDETRKALLQGIQKSHKYDYPIDACDQMIFNIINNMRANAGAVLLDELSDDLIIEDDYNEFASTADEEYLQRQDYAQTTNLRPKGEK